MGFPPPNIDGMTHAWVHTINHPDGRPSLDGMAEGYLFDEVGRSRMTVVSFWPSAEAASSARAALAPAVGGSVVRDEVYEVLHDVAGGAPAGARPVAAALLDFTGPISPAVFEAAERGFRDRIRPLLTGLTGCIRGLVLWQPDTGAQLVVNVTDSLEALGAGERAINSAPLLPGEDPALLPGPDRVSIQTVVSTIRSAHPEGALR